jgi:hypothetical protein
MLSPKPFRLLALLLGGTLALAACGGQPSAPVSAAVAPTAAPAVATSTSTLPPAATLAPTAISSQPIPTAAPQPSATSVPSSVSPTGAPGLARGALTQRPLIAMIDNHPDAYPQTGLDRAAGGFLGLGGFCVTRVIGL